MVQAAGVSACWPHAQRQSRPRHQVRFPADGSLHDGVHRWISRILVGNNPRNNERFSDDYQLEYGQSGTLDRACGNKLGYWRSGLFHESWGNVSSAPESYAQLDKGVHDNLYAD